MVYSSIVSTMDIQINNWQNGQSSKCRLVVIRGSIVYNETVVVAANDDIQIICDTTGDWPVVSGLFKAVVHLTRNENIIEFRYGQSKRTLTIDWRPDDTDYCIVPLYVICEGHDGRFQAPDDFDNSVLSACSRIAFAAFLVQCLFAEKLLENGFSRKTFQVENDIFPDSPRCRILKSRLSVDEARQLDQESLWAHIGREIMTSDLGSERRKYLAILSCTHWDGTKIFGDPALGGGGLALLGSASIHTWPTSVVDVVKCFTDQRPIHPGLFDNSCFRGTFSGSCSTSLGSVCHEVGHMFNLGHTETGIMSRGFDNVGRVFIALPPFDAKRSNKSIEEKSEFVLVPSLLVGSEPQSITRKTDRSPSASVVDDDLTSLTFGCAAILTYHRWFNTPLFEDNSISYDPIRNIVSSDSGLKVVQLRSTCGSVVKSWELGSKSPHKHLILPRLKVSPITLFAINSCGVILTETVDK